MWPGWRATTGLADTPRGLLALLGTTLQQDLEGEKSHTQLTQSQLEEGSVSL